MKKTNNCKFENKSNESELKRKTNSSVLENKSNDSEKMRKD